MVRVSSRFYFRIDCSRSSLPFPFSPSTTQFTISRIKFTYTYVLHPDIHLNMYIQNMTYHFYFSRIQVLPDEFFFFFENEEKNISFYFKICILIKKKMGIKKINNSSRPCRRDVYFAFLKIRLRELESIQCLARNS